MLEAAAPSLSGGQAGDLGDLRAGVNPSMTYVTCDPGSDPCEVAGRHRIYIQSCEKVMATFFQIIFSNIYLPPNCIKKIGL